MMLVLLLCKQLVDSMKRFFVEMIAPGNLQFGMQQFRSLMLDWQGNSTTKARLSIGFYRCDGVISSIVFALDSKGGLFIIEHAGQTHQADRARTDLRLDVRVNSYRRFAATAKACSSADLLPWCLHFERASRAGHVPEMPASISIMLIKNTIFSKPPAQAGF